MTILDCHKKRCDTIISLNVRIGISSKKNIDYISVAILCCHEKRCITIISLNIGISICL